jgi:hypothetical protein
LLVPNPFAYYQTPPPAGVVSLSVGDWDWQSTGESPVTIVIGDDIYSPSGLFDSFHVGDSRIERVAPPMDFGEYALFQWELKGPSSVLASGKLPRSAFPLDPWTENRWSISIWGSPPAPLLELSGAVSSFQAVALSDLADFNGDGLVDIQDLALWKGNVGKSSGATLNEGDADGDGDIDGSDFLVWQRQSTGGSTVSAVVPEPATFALLSACAAFLARGHLQVRR